MEKRNYLEIAKEITIVVVSAGATIVTHNAIQHVSPAQVKPLMKMVTGATTCVLGAMMSDKCVDYIETKYTELTSKLRESFAETEPEQKEDV